MKSVLVFLVLSIFLSFIAQSTVYSLSAEQRAIISSGSSFFDLNPTEYCSTTRPAARATSLSMGSSIYVLGDSLSVRAEPEIEQALTSEDLGYLIAGYNADSGRAISSDTAGAPLAPSGIEAVINDSTIISAVDAVVISLGANSGNEDLNTQIPLLIEAVRDAGFSKDIYWVNVISDDESTPERNAVIESLKVGLGYTVIDAASQNIPLEDGVHPTDGDGEEAFAEALAAGLQTPTSELVQQTSTGLCACGSNGVLGFAGGPLNNSITWGEGPWGPNSGIYSSGLGSGPYTVEQWAIHVLKNIAIKTGLPESQLVTQGKVISLVAWSRAEGGGIKGNVGSFNPLNTKLRHSDLNAVSQGNISRDADSSGFPDFDTGVEASTRAIFGTYQKRIGSALLQPGLSDLDFIEAVAGDFYSTNGSDVVNRLDNIYPGDLAFATMSITGFIFDESGQNHNGGVGDRDLYVEAKRGALESVKKNYEEIAGQRLDSFGQLDPPPGETAPLIFLPNGPVGAQYSGSACEQDSGGTVSSQGYAFPLAPQTQGVSVDWNHYGDGTAAVDMFSEDSADVYSIFSGTAVTINTNFGDVRGCSSIQFQADDGYFYWYGHLKNVTISEGERVEAGVKIAEVADNSFGGDCVGGEPHLHIDRGCVIDGVAQRGGGIADLEDPDIPKECRDPELIPLLRTLYDGLPRS